MSAPARAVAPATLPAPSPRRGPAPPRPAPPPRRRARRSPRSPLPFLVLASVIVGSMVLGLASLNALLAQNQFRIETLSLQLDRLTDENGRLRREAAHQSAPGRIAGWARLHHMRLPDDPHILHVRTAGTQTAPAGGSDPQLTQAGESRP